MSWEGYYQCICKNGHYYKKPDAVYGDSTCPFCHSQAEWANEVNDTNIDSFGIIPLELLKEHYLVSKEVSETCNLGHTHVTKYAIFRIPSEEETKALRHWQPDHGGTPFVLIAEKNSQ